MKNIAKNYFFYFLSKKFLTCRLWRRAATEPSKVSKKFFHEQMPHDVN